MSVNWQPIETAPQDRVIYIWSDRGGIVRVTWFKNDFSAYWKEVPANDDPAVMICSSSLHRDEHSHWCEVVEIEPAGAKKVRNYNVKKLV